MSALRVYELGEASLVDGLSGPVRSRSPMATRTPFGRGGVRRALALLAAIGLSGCPATRSCGNEPDSARRAASVTNEASQPAAEKLPLNPFERRAALDAAYRLKPDRRILLAVEAVRFFVAGSPGSATAIQEGETLAHPARARGRRNAAR